MIRQLESGNIAVVGIDDDDRAFFNNCNIIENAVNRIVVRYNDKEAVYIGRQYWVSVVRPDLNGASILIVRAPGIKGGWKPLLDVVIGSARYVFTGSVLFDV